MHRILVTTSRAPSPRTRSFVKDLVAVLPGAVRVTRGHLTMEELAMAAVDAGANRVVIVGERRGNPSIIRVYEVHPGGPELVNIVTFIVRGLSLAREGRRPLPSAPPKTLYVAPEAEEVYDVADAFILAFNARLLAGNRKPGAGDIVAILRPGEESAVIVEFAQRGKRVGPRIRLARPREMVKRRGASIGAG